MAGGGDAGLLKLTTTPTAFKQEEYRGQCARPGLHVVGLSTSCLCSMLPHGRNFLRRGLRCWRVGMTLRKRLRAFGGAWPNSMPSAGRLSGRWKRSSKSWHPIVGHPKDRPLPMRRSPIIRHRSRRSSCSAVCLLDAPMFFRLAGKIERPSAQDIRRPVRTSGRRDLRQTEGEMRRMPAPGLHRTQRRYYGKTPARRRWPLRRLRRRPVSFAPGRNVLVSRRGLRQGRLGRRCQGLAGHLPCKGDCRRPGTVAIGEWRPCLDILR